MKKYLWNVETQLKEYMEKKILVSSNKLHLKMQCISNDTNKLLLNAQLIVMPLTI